MFVLKCSLIWINNNQINQTNLNNNHIGNDTFKHKIDEKLIDLEKQLIDFDWYFVNFKYSAEFMRFYDKNVDFSLKIACFVNSKIPTFSEETSKITVFLRKKY